MDAVFHTESAVFNYRVAGVWIMEGHVLLHRDKNDSHWSLPGGRVRIGEESSLSLEREFQEELGVTINVEQILWTSENFFQYHGKNFHEIGFYYKVNAKENILKQESFLGLEGDRLIYQWIRLEELKELSIQPDFLKEKLTGNLNQLQHMVVNNRK
jgi:8-oxo-dGTP pyrophosphatase MutT (NUDIX family)